MRNRLTTSLISLGLPSRRAAAEAATLSQSHGGSGSSVASIPHFFRVDFAQSTQTVLYVMAGIMAAAAIVAILGLRAGVQQDIGAVSETPTQEPAVADEPG
jgi:ABC-type Na+ efflux pump permease subunit